MNEKVNDVWEGDKLGRRASATFLENYLVRRSHDTFSHLDRRSLVVNLKGEWGSGKTFFLKKFAKQLRASGHLVAEVDAWKTDPDLDPLISLISATQDAIDEKFKAEAQLASAWSSFKAKAGTLLVVAAKGAAKTLGRKLMGDALEEFADTFSSKTETEFQSNKKNESDELNLTDSASTVIEDAIFSAAGAEASAKVFESEIALAKERRKAIDEFSKSLTSLAEKIDNLESGKAPIFVLVDELDRCSPTRAILFLERINHMFDTAGVVFVVGSDSDQLQHSISAVYGEGFDTRGYLERFFSFTYNLAAVNGQELSNQCIANLEISENRFSGFKLDDQTYLQSLSHIVSASELTAREIKQFFFLVSVLMDVWYEKTKIDLLWMIGAVLIIQFQLKETAFSNVILSEQMRTKLAGLLAVTFPVWDGGGSRHNQTVENYLSYANGFALKTSNDASNELQRNRHLYGTRFSQIEMTLPYDRLKECRGRFLFFDYLFLLKHAVNFSTEI